MSPGNQAPPSNLRLRVESLDTERQDVPCRICGVGGTISTFGPIESKLSLQNYSAIAMSPIYVEIWYGVLTYLLKELFSPGMNSLSIL